MKHRPFHPQNNFTVFSNYILDVIMPALKPTHWKVLCFIIRKTIGWQKDQDVLSYSQIMEGTGIASKTTIYSSLSELSDLNYITVIETSEGTANEYRLNTEYEVNMNSTKNEQEGDTPTKSVQVPPQKVYTQKKRKEIPPTEVPMEREPLVEKFQSLVAELKKANNRPAILMDVWKLCYGDDNPPSYGYLGKVAKQIGGAGYLAQRLWELSARPPNGDVLAYILAEHQRKKKYRKNHNDGGRKRMQEL